jgi:branched-chain amino acid transport system ATP-binding protein
MALLELEDVVACYGAAEALHGVSLTLRDGEIVAVLGPNGAGKSTLLRTICGTHVRLFKGRMAFGGIDLSRLSAEQRVGAGICLCPEGRHLFPDLSVRRNLELGAYLQGWTRTAEERLDFVHDLFPILRARSGQRCGTLSGGEQQMVAIGRALMGRPRLLLLDEPSVGIAHKLKAEIFAAIARVRDLGAAVLLAEQDASHALDIADRAILIEGGEIQEAEIGDGSGILATLAGI